MADQVLSWPADVTCMRVSPLGIRHVATEVYTRTCRTGFDQPGFVLLNVGDSINSIEFRQLMVDLKDSMASLHEDKANKTLSYLSAARFDQQETTRPHLDGGPNECFLMLGYEPSDVDSELEISDYTKCSFELNLDPMEFMAKHNPMFQEGYELLQPYTTRIPCFSSCDFQIVCINNSSAPYVPGEPAWQGTLHTARILNPDESKRRVINSTMIASMPLGTADVVTKSSLLEFTATSSVKRKGYDKSHLADD